MVAVLTGVALVVANAFGLVLLRDFLTDRLDDQLAAMSRPFAASIRNEGPLGLAGRVGVPRVGPDQAVYLIHADGTRTELRGPAAGSPALPDAAALTRRIEPRQPFTVPDSDGGASWRVLAVPASDGDIGVLAVSLAEVEQTTNSLLMIDLVVTTFVLVMLGLGAAGVVRLGLRPLTRMGASAAAISAGNVAGRITGADPHTEPGRLGAALNAMLERLATEIEARAGSERRIRQFVADASHELRTPLTSIRGFAELYRRGGALPGPELDEMMARIEGEAARMGLLVEDLLLLAQLDRQRPLRRGPVDLLALVADTIRDAHARTPERRVLLGGDDLLEPVTVSGDDHRLRQVVTNLITNALRHTGPEATVTVSVLRRAAPSTAAVTSRPVPPGVGECAVIEVADTGQGIPAEHAGRVFERLYRADDSGRVRGDGRGGAGLGLTIAAAIAHSHGGWIELATTPGAGATFRVVLPGPPTPAPPDSQPTPSRPGGRSESPTAD